MQTNGQQAEQAASTHLSRLGYSIVCRNWKIPQAEIDIVASTKSRVLCFVEVKYRKSGQAGFGYEYVTERKLQQMARAAQFFCLSNQRYSAFQPQLMVVSVSGSDFSDVKVILVD